MFRLFCSSPFIMTLCDVTFAIYHNVIWCYVTIRHVRMIFSEWRTRIRFMLVCIWTLEIKQCVQYKKNLVKINNEGLIGFFFTRIWLLDWYFTVETITFGNFLTTHIINTYIIKILLKQKQKTLLIIYIIMWYSICSITIQNLYRGMKFVFRQQLRLSDVIFSGSLSWQRPHYLPWRSPVLFVTKMYYDIFWFLSLFFTKNNFGGIYKWWA